jgi:type I restriction enzyme S subunit
LLVLKPKGEKDIQFFEYRLNRINLFVESTGVPQLTAPQISGYKIKFPSLPEQQKIASFLTAVDQRIQLLQKKKAKLEEYKKGVMQKLFSQEIRFKIEGPDGELVEPPDWEEKKLGEICLITTGKLDANAMVDNGEFRFYTCAKDYFKIDKYAFDFEALLISGNGANVGYIHHYKGKFNAYQRTYVLYNLSENYKYIKYFLNQYLQRRIHREKKDGNTPYIVMSTLTEMAIKIPSLPEQKKIARFLTSLDESIEMVEIQIESTTLFKKGLLQKMFV